MFDRNGNDNSNYNQMIVEEISKSSEKVADLVNREYLRQKNNVELIASENYCSDRLKGIRETRADTMAERLS